MVLVSPSLIASISSLALLMLSWIEMLGALWRTIIEIIFFWQLVWLYSGSDEYVLTEFQRFISWCKRQRPRDFWYTKLKSAVNYEDFEEAAWQLDLLSGNDLWYAGSCSH